MKMILRLCLILLAALLAVELALQLLFLHLPLNLIQRMPQYQDRAGYRLETEHGARELPANTQIDVLVTPHSGDLYSLSCLDASDAESFPGYRVRYQRDHRGFRNAEPWPDDIELAILGDSFTAAEMIQAPYWEGLSDAQLVLGLPGSGTLEQTRLLKAFGLPRKPETVILAYFAGNDMADNLIFSQLQRENQPFARRAHAGRMPHEYLVIAHIGLYLRDLIAAARPADCPYPQVAMTQPPTPVVFYDAFLPLLAMDAAALSESEMGQATSAALIDLASQLDQGGMRLVLMYIPQKAELYWRYLAESSKAAILARLPSDGAAISSEMIDANLSRQRDWLKALCAEYEIDFLDMTPLLREAIEEGAAPYFLADTHWNQIGHNLARQALRDFLK